MVKTSVGHIKRVIAQFGYEPQIGYFVFDFYDKIDGLYVHFCAIVKNGKYKIYANGQPMKRCWYWPWTFRSK